MMDDILKQIKAGEVSGVQFKERILDKYDIACELVAFSNSHGGKLVVGIKDKTGETNALSYSEVQETTNLLSDIASENVVPSILIKIDTVEVEDGNLVVATQVEEKSNQVEDHNTGLRHSDTDLDTRLRHSDTGLRHSDTGLRHSDTRLRHSDTDLDTRLRHSDTNLDTSDTDLDTQLRPSDTPKVSLSNKQRDIVNFCSVPRTTKEILDRIGVSMHSKNRERYITSLVAAGYLQMTNPDNPTASNQKYKKVNRR